MLGAQLNTLRTILTASTAHIPSYRSQTHDLANHLVFLIGFFFFFFAIFPPLLILIETPIFAGLVLVLGSL